jgi:hypothetical protein
VHATPRLTSGRARPLRGGQPPVTVGGAYTDRPRLLNASRYARSPSLATLALAFAFSTSPPLTSSAVEQAMRPPRHCRRYRARLRCSARAEASWARARAPPQCSASSTPLFCQGSGPLKVLCLVLVISDNA